MKKLNVILITIVAIVATLIVSIVITLNVLASKRDLDAVAYVHENFQMHAEAQLKDVKLPDMFKTIIEKMTVVSSQLNENKDAVDVHFTLPDFNGLNAARDFKSYDSKLTYQNPISFISSFSEYCKVVVRTLPSRSYTVSLPVDLSSLNYNVEWSELDYIGIIERYGSDFSREMHTLIRHTNLGAAVADYLFPNPLENESNEESDSYQYSNLFEEYCREMDKYLVDYNISSFGNDVTDPEGMEILLLERLHSFLLLTDAWLEVGDYGEVQLNVISYNSALLLDNAAQEIYRDYESRFLTADVSQREIEIAVFSAMSMLAQDLRGQIDAGESIALGDAVIEAAHETYVFDVFNTSIKDIRTDASIAALAAKHLKRYDDALTSLKAQMDALQVHIPLPEPNNGVLVGASSGLSLIIENSKGYGAHYIMFVALPDDGIDGAGTEHLGVYIRESEVFTVRLPAGTYRVKYASGSGENWYGLRYLFGPSGSYRISKTTITLSSGVYELSLNTADSAGEAVEEESVPFGSW